MRGGGGEGTEFHSKLSHLFASQNFLTCNFEFEILEKTMTALYCSPESKESVNLLIIKSALKRTTEHKHAHSQLSKIQKISKFSLTFLH